MSIDIIFNIQLIGGYLAWIAIFATYVWPNMKGTNADTILRFVAVANSFRFIGLVFIIPGVVGNLPQPFSVAGAYGDLATAVLAFAALALYRLKPLFLALIVACNLVGTVDIANNYFNAIQLGLPIIAGELRSAYYIPTLIVPLLVLSHLTAFYVLLRWRQFSRTLHV